MHHVLFYNVDDDDVRGDKLLCNIIVALFAFGIARYVPARHDGAQFI